MSETPAADILLVDDHPLFVDGFAAMVRERRPGWSLITGTTVAAGLDLAAGHTALDLAIVDLKLPDADGFAMIAHLALTRPDLPTLVISGREDSVARLRARQSGARGFVSKTEPVETILATIERVIAGGDGFAIAAPADGLPVPTLSARQMEVLALLAEGCANKEIRHHLHIAERTVRAHLTEIFQALQATSRVQALLRARKLGLIE